MIMMIMDIYVCDDDYKRFITMTIMKLLMIIIMMMIVRMIMILVMMVMTMIMLLMMMMIMMMIMMKTKHDNKPQVSCVEHHLDQPRS